MGGRVGTSTVSEVRDESNLRSLYEWLQSASFKGEDRHLWDLWVTIMGIAFGFAGGAAIVISAVLGVDLEQSPHFWFVPFCFATITSLASGAIIAYRQLKFNGERVRLFAEAERYIWRLRMARWDGSLKDVLSEDHALTLNRGAEYFLSCNQALKTQSWKSAGKNSEYAAVRKSVGKAMAIAMAQLLTTIDRGAPGSAPEIQSLLADMKQTAKESVKLAARLDEQKGLHSHSHHLRQTLSQLRMLNDAQDEVEETT